MAPFENHYTKLVFKDEAIESFPESTEIKHITDKNHNYVLIKNEFNNKILEDHNYLEEASLEINNECSGDTVDNLPEFSVLQFIEKSLIQNYFLRKDEIYHHYEMDKLKEEMIETKYEIDEHEMNNYFRNNKIILEEIVDNKIYNYFEILEEFGIEKWLKVEPSLEIFDENSEENFKDETNSEIEFKEDENLITQYFEILDVSDDDLEIVEGNTFELIEEITDEMNCDTLSPVTTELNSIETVNVEIDIFFDLTSQQKCIKIYEILDQNNNKEEEVILIEMSPPHKEFICLICVKYFENKKSLMKHNLIHTSKKHQCTQCQDFFDSFVKLKKHFQCHNSAEKESSVFSCDICDYTTNRLFNLKKHQKIHSKFNAKKKSKSL